MKNKFIPLIILLVISISSIVVWFYLKPVSQEVEMIPDVVSGTLWAWGDNDRGQLGLGDTVNRYVPIQVGRDTDWKMVAAGRHAIAIKEKLR